MKKVLILILIQLLGLSLCIVLALPLIQGSPNRVEASSVPRVGPYLTAVTTPSLDDFPARLEAPRVSLNITDVVKARLAEQISLQSELTGRYRFRWDDLGAAIVPARDVEARRHLVRQGYQLRDGVLKLSSGEEIKATYGLRGERARDLLGAIARVVDRDAIRASWDFDNDRAIPHRTGLRLDIEASLQRLHDALLSGAQETPLIIHEDLPAASTDNLGDFTPSVRMAFFKTKYKNKRNRTTNLRLASAAINGTILMPGESFSYNATVGPRTEARGYKEAPVIVQGEMVEGMGGGACQVSSTLYAASLFAGLDIPQRSNHSLPSNYIEKGFDAVVAWPNLDLRLRNSYDSPVVLRMYLRDGSVYAEILGTKTPHRVVVRRELAEKFSFNAQVEVTTELEEGEVKVKQRGGSGYRVTRGRIVWRDDKEHFEALPVDVYKSRQRRVRIGPNTLYPLVEEEEVIDPTAPPDDSPKDAN